MHRHPAFALALGPLVVTGCGVLNANGPYSLSIQPDLQPRLRAADAVQITRNYLDAQTPEIADPDEHIAPDVSAVWAVSASRATAIDDCIPSEQANAIVWVTKGVGDYLNLTAHAWSPSSHADDARCAGPGPAGTIVIDDATGVILGVYPEGPVLHHVVTSPSP